MNFRFLLSVVSSFGFILIFWYGRDFSGEELAEIDGDGVGSVELGGMKKSSFRAIVGFNSFDACEDIVVGLGGKSCFEGEGEGVFLGRVEIEGGGGCGGAAGVGVVE